MQNNYNLKLSDKERIKKDFSPLFSIFNSKENTKTELVDLVIKDSELSFSECLIENVSYRYSVDFIVEIVENNSARQFIVPVTIPKMHMGSFLIKGKDGLVKRRSSITIGRITNNIVVSKNKLGTPFFYIKLQNKEKTIVYKNDKEKIEEELTSFLDNLNDKVFCDISENQNFKDKYEYLTGNIIGNEFKKEHFLDLLNCYEKDKNKFINFTPFDLLFFEQYETLVEELTKTNSYKEIVKKNARDLLKKGCFDGSAIELEIQKIFSMRPTINENIQTASDSNACSLISQNKKIYFLMGKKQRRIQFSSLFYGLICPFKTPESASLTNIKNELTKDVSIKDLKAFIRIKYLDGLKEEFLEYRDFFHTKILLMQNYDYTNNKIILNKNGKINYLYNGEFHEGCIEDVEAIFYSEDSDLAYTTSLLPFINHTDSIRVAMANNMFDQIMPIRFAKPSPIYTDVEKEIYSLCPTNLQSTIDGTVVEIYQNFIKIKNEEDFAIFTMPTTLQTVAGTQNKFSFTVSVGDKVVKNQIIGCSNSFDNEQLSLHTPLFVAYGFHGLYGEEDGCLISDEVVNKLAHDSEKDFIFSVPISDRCIMNLNKINEFEIINNLNDIGLPIIGHSYKKNETFCAYLIKENHNNDFSLIKHKIPNNIEEARIISVEVAIPNGITEDGLPIIRKRFQEIKEEEEKTLNNFFQNKKIIKKDFLLQDKKERVIIKIKVAYYHLATEGAKICNRFGSKYSVVKIEKKENMPRIGGKDGIPLDLIFFPKAPINRKNLSSLMEPILGLACYKGFALGEKYIKEEKIDKLKKMLLTLYKEVDNLNHEEVIKFHNEFKTFGYYRLKIKAKNKTIKENEIVNICRETGVNVFDGDNLFLPNYKKLTRNKVVTGFSSISRLHFLQDKKMTATGDWNKNKKLTLGVGEYKVGGAKIAEMESWSLMSYNCLEEVLEELSGCELNKTIKRKLKIESNVLGLELKEEVL